MSNKHYQNERTLITPDMVGQYIDPLMIASIYQLGSGSVQWLKKDLVAGRRGAKSYEQDCEEADRARVEYRRHRKSEAQSTTGKVFALNEVNHD